MRALILLMALALGLAHTSAQQSEALVAFDAEYKVRMKGLGGELRMALTQNDVGFFARSVIEPRGLAGLFASGQLEETAGFVLEGDSLQPTGFRSVDSISRDEKFTHIDFDWRTSSATGHDEDGAFEHPLDAETYDRLTLQYALMYALSTGDAERDFKLIDGSRYKELDVSILGEQSIRVPHGKYDTIGVRHQAQGSSRATTLWCAPALGYLPVRIEQHRKGKRIVLAELTDYRR